MNSHLKKIGCDTPLYCAPCLGKVRGGFDPQSGIVVCEDTNPTTRRLEATLVHEMVHAFDRCRFKVDYNNIKHAACTEVDSSMGFVVNVDSCCCTVERMSVFG